MTNLKKIAMGMAMACMCHMAIANVPVVNLNGEASTNDEKTTVYGDNAATLSVEDRVAVLERQVANLNKQDVLSKIQDLQSQVQQLQGKVDELTHQHQALADQMKQQYQDLNDRLTATSANANAAPAPEAKPKAKTAKANAPAETASATAVDANLNAASDDSAVDNQAETAAYQKGFNLLKKGDYVRATPAFENFLKTYPKGPHAPNAHFWLGEIHLAQNQADAAAQEYRRVINDFPTSDKVQMAQLKLGVAYHDQGDLCKAKSAFEKVIKLYPKTSAASMAKKALVDIPSPCSERKTA